MKINKIMMNKNKFLIFIIILYYSRLNTADVLEKKLSVTLQNALSMLKDKSINTWKDWCLVGGAGLLTLIVFWFCCKKFFKLDKENKKLKKDNNNKNNQNLNQLDTSINNFSSSLHVNISQVEPCKKNYHQSKLITLSLKEPSTQSNYDNTKQNILINKSEENNYKLELIELYTARRSGGSDYKIDFIDNLLIDIETNLIRKRSDYIFYLLKNNFDKDRLQKCEDIKRINANYKYIYFDNFQNRGYWVRSAYNFLTHSYSCPELQKIMRDHCSDLCKKYCGDSCKLNCDHSYCYDVCTEHCIKNCKKITLNEFKRGDVSICKKQYQDLCEKLSGDLCDDMSVYFGFAEDRVPELHSVDDIKESDDNIYILSEITSYKMLFASVGSFIEIIYNLTDSMLFNLINVKENNQKLIEETRISLVKRCIKIDLSEDRVFMISKVIGDNKQIVVSYLSIKDRANYIEISDIITRKTFQGLGLAGILLNELNKFNKPQLLLCSSANEAGKKCYTKSGFKSVTVGEFLREKNVLWEDIREALHSGLEKKHVALEDYVFLKGV